MFAWLKTQKCADGEVAMLKQLYIKDYVGLSRII